MTYKFNRLYIIESLSEDELKTGKYLNESFLHLNERDKYFDVEYQPLKNFQGLKIFSQVIINEIITKGVMPLLHFEMHGCNQGLIFNSGETVAWTDFAKIIQPISIVTKNKLFVVLALCHGGHFLNALEEFMNDRTPFAGLLSSFDYLTSGEVREGFGKYYLSLFKYKNGTVALKELNTTIKDENRKYIFFSCSYLFRLAFIEYLKTITNKRIAESTNRVLSGIKNNNRNVDITSTRKQLKKFFHKTNQKEFFEDIKSYFLMFDLDPKNKNNFDIDYSEVFQQISSH